MAAWERSKDKFGVSVKRGTSDVPDDGRYHVVVDGVIVLSTGVEALAIAEFEEVFETRRQEGLKQLQVERANADFRSIRSSSWAAKSKRDSRTGGRGGSGRR